MFFEFLMRQRDHLRQSGPPVWLAAAFLICLLLDRLNGWQVGSGGALLAGALLAVSMFRRQTDGLVPFLVVLVLAIVWMISRDVTQGSDWKAGERTVKAALLTLGLLACCRLSVQQWRLALGATVLCGGVAMAAYVGPQQVLRAWLAPLELGSAGGLVTAMNRNGLALPLGLLSCWALAAFFQCRPRWPWLLPALALLVLMLANGSRNAIAAMGGATLFMLYLQVPGRALFVALGIVLSGLLIHEFFPAYWVHGSLFNQRDVIWAEVFRHLPEHLWFGAGSVYFRQTVAPLLPVDVIIAHNAYLDFLLAYGVVGVLLMAAAGLLLARLTWNRVLSPQLVWCYASFAFLALFGLFDRGHRDALMLAAMLMLPGLFVVAGRATAQFVGARFAGRGELPEERSLR